MSKHGTLITVADDQEGANPQIITPNNPFPIVEGFDIPIYDYVALAYVAAGAAIDEIETVTYKAGGSGGTTVATLTLTYNVDGLLATTTKT